MSALLETRTALTAELAAVTRRIGESRQDFHDALDDQADVLRQAGDETRQRVGHAVNGTTDALRDIAALSDDLAEVRRTLTGLREAVDRLPAPAAPAAPAPAAPAPAGPEPAAPATGSPATTKAPAPALERDTGSRASTASAGLSEPDVSVPAFAPAGHCPAAHAGALRSAARLAVVDLECHPDTWEWLVARAGEHPHFRRPDATAREAGLVCARLSGRSVLAVLITLWDVRRDAAADDADRALADALYERFTDPLPRLHRTGQRVTVVLNDGAGEPACAAPKPPAPATWHHG